MKSKRLASNRSYVEKEGEDEAANQLSGEVILGHLIWVRLHGSSWWPAQVVDENTVSGSNKPSNRSDGEVLVRLYGSYKYMYVDPMKCRSEFEKILKQHNGSYNEIIKKVLEQDLPRFNSGRSKGKGSKSEGKGVDPSQDKRLTKKVIKKGQEIKSPTSINGALGKLPAASVWGTRMLKTDFDTKTSMDNASENEGTKQRSVKKNLSQARVKAGNSLSEKNEKTRSRKRKQDEVQRKLEPNSPKSERISPRRLPAASTLQAKMKNGNLLSEETAEAKTKKQKQDGAQRKLETNNPRSVRISLRGLLSESTEEARSKKGKEDTVQKKLKLNCPSNARISQRRPAAASKPQTVVKNGNLFSEKAEGPKSNNQNQDGMLKKLVPNSPSLLIHSASRPQAKVKNGNLLSKKSEEARSKAMNRDEVQRKLTPNNSKAATTPIGKSQELSARRMKVMQSLGLIPPSGSPFNRNGNIYPKPVSLRVTAT